MKREPNPIMQRETSKLLPMLSQALREEGVSKFDIAKDLKVYAEELDSLIFNLAMIKLGGGLKDRTPGDRLNARHLKLVK